MSEIVYITGPMTGIKDFNAAAFDKAEDELEERGYTVINPSAEDRETHDLGEQPNWLEALKRDIASVCSADVVAVLPGWEKSDGAKLEVFTALRLKLPVIDAETTKPIDLCAYAPPIIQITSPSDYRPGDERWQYIRGKS